MSHPDLDRRRPYALALLLMAVYRCANWIPSRHFPVAQNMLSLVHELASGQTGLNVSSLVVTVHGVANIFEVTHSALGHLASDRGYFGTPVESDKTVACDGCSLRHADHRSRGQGTVTEVTHLIVVAACQYTLGPPTPRTLSRHLLQDGFIPCLVCLACRRLSRPRPRLHCRQVSLECRLGRSPAAFDAEGFSWISKTTTCLSETPRRRASYTCNSEQSTLRGWPSRLLPYRTDRLHLNGRR